jgi:hypothetical protein
VKSLVTGGAGFIAPAPETCVTAWPAIDPALVGRVTVQEA